MKKFAIILACLMGSLSFAAAQEVYDVDNEYNWQNRKSSLSLAIGAPSLVSSIESIGTVDITKSSFSGAASIRYDYNVLRWLAVGGRFSYDGWQKSGTSRDYSYTYNESEDRYINSYEEHEVNCSGHRGSVLMEILFTYINREHVQLYSGLALGMQYYVQNKHDGQEKASMIAGSVIPIGVHAGGEHVYALAEVSLGTESMMSFGIGFHF